MLGSLLQNWHKEKVNFQETDKKLFREVKIFSFIIMSSTIMENIVWNIKMFTKGGPGKK